MKRICFVFMFCIFCTLAHGQGANFFNINGKTKPEYNGRDVVLLSHDGFRYRQISTTKVKNGTFQFKGKVNISNFSVVALDSYSESNPNNIHTKVILEKGNIRLDLDDTPVVGGTPMNNALEQYKQWTNEYPTKQRVDFIKKNSLNILGRKALLDHIHDLSDSEVKEIMSVAGKTFRRDRELAMAIQSKSILSNMKKGQQLREGLKGNKYQDFNLVTSSGERRKLSDYVGKSKYVVMGFWASWCIPGVTGMPHMKMLHDKYKDKGLEFIGISLDSESTKDDWISTANRLNVSWDQLSDLKGNESLLSKAYGVSDVPYAVVINEQGIIVDCVRFPGKNLEPVLEKLP